METKQGKQQGTKSTKKSRGISAGIVIAVCAVIAILFFNFWLGNPANFVNNDPAGHPLPGNYWGTVYKGGPVVCIVITLMLTVIALSVERFFAINKAKGTGNLIKFVADVKVKLEAGDIEGAQALCSKQKGSVASVVSSGLRKYSEVENTTEEMSKDQKLLAIQKEIEEATALELPTMEQNLPVVAAISTLGTLFGLLGTVLGMIRSFSALANEGAPDSVALATGISEALVNTALGIGTGALAIISYSYFTGKIDNITYAIDETGFSIVQTYAEKHK
jgi:biopolymer transport protein ExbB